MQIPQHIESELSAARARGDSREYKRLLASIRPSGVEGRGGSAIAQHIAHARRLVDDLKARVARARRGRPGASMAGDVLALHRALSGRTAPAPVSNPVCRHCGEAEDGYGYCYCGG